jgi:hypothetical protein
MMKRIFTFLVLLALVVMWSTVGWTAALGTITQTIDQNFVEQSRVSKVVTFTCTGSADDGSFPATATNTAISEAINGYYLYKVIVKPGTTNPTAAWDFTIVDGDGLDILGGTGTDMSASAVAMIAPKLNSSTYFAQPIIGPVTLTITNNSVHSAGITIKAIFVK